VENMV